MLFYFFCLWVHIYDSLESEKFNWTRTIVMLSIGFIFTIGGANFVIESGTNIDL